MKLFHTLLLSLLALILSSCGSHELFKDGKSKYSIVLSQDAPESEKYAARELQYWIKEVSGVELPIAGLESGKKGHRLVVGFNPLVRDEALAYDFDNAMVLQSIASDIQYDLSLGMNDTTIRLAGNSERQCHA